MVNAQHSRNDSNVSLNLISVMVSKSQDLSLSHLITSLCQVLVKVDLPQFLKHVGNGKWKSPGKWSVLGIVEHFR